MGYQAWGCRSLEALIAEPDHTVALVITHPHGDDPYEHVWTDSVTDLARREGIEALEVGEAEIPTLRERITLAGAEIIVASNWRSRVHSEVLSLVPQGGVNIHDSLLPRYRGFAPLNWAVIRGEVEVGITAHLMSPDLDLGDIVVQERIPIGDDETIREIAGRVLDRVGPVTIAALERVRTPGFRATPQDPAQSTMFHRRSVRDSRIVWTNPARTVHNLVRAQVDPYPNAYAYHEGRRLEVTRTALPTRAYCGTPGRVVTRACGGGVVVICGPDGGTVNEGLVVLRVRPEGSAEMDAAAYFTCTGVDLE
jgi:methionyl-tRNA formyltransferase